MFQAERVSLWVLMTSLLSDILIPRQIITGATGALGAHLVAQFVARTSMRIVALVRAVDHDDAARRMILNLERRKLLADTGTDRITSLAADFGEDKLGLDEQMYTDFLKTAEIVIHVRQSC